MRGTPGRYGRIGALSLALACLIGLVASPSTLFAFKAAPGYSAGNYATGFPSNPKTDWGPIGVAFDDSDNLYVADNADGNIYRFQPGGGEASAATRLTPAPIKGDIKGLAITRDGSIYLARSGAGDVVQIDPVTGQVMRVVIDGIPCATALAVDPVSGDLFVSQNECGPTIYRLSGVDSGHATANPYTSLCCVDGIAFGPDGTLYAMSGGQAVKVDGTNTSSPGAARSIASVPHADGVTVGPPSSPGEQPFLVVNGNDGRITRVDFSQSPPAQSPVLSGGTRGDFAAVDSRGCLYATQSRSVVRIAPNGRSCELTPSTPAPIPGTGPPQNQQSITVDVVSPRAAAAPTREGAAPRCVQLRKLVLRVRQHGRVRLRWIKVFIGTRRVQTLHNRRVTSRITLRNLPRGSFSVKLVARTTKGRTLTATKRFRNC